MDIVKIGIFGVAAAFLALLLGQWKKEYSIFISIAAGLLIFAAVVTKVRVILDFTQKLENLAAVDSGYIRLVIKMVGITYVAEFAVNVCRDAGYAAIAGQIENFAKLSILGLSLPVLSAFLELIGSLL